MSLATIKTKIIRSSGRKNYETSAGSAILTDLVNVAQVLLDDEVWNFRKSRAVKVIQLVAGMYFASFTYARRIERVTVVNADGLTELDLNTNSLEELRQAYAGDANTVVSHTGTITLKTTGDVVAKLTSMKDDLIVTGQILFLPNSDGGLWLLLDVVSYLGTVSIANDGTITGTDTQFVTDGVESAMYISIPADETVYKINVVSTETKITLLDEDGSGYSGGVQTDKEYIILTALDGDGSAYSAGALADQSFYVMTSNADRGTPVYGAENIIRIAPGTTSPLPSLNTADLISKVGGESLRDGLLFYPPADGVYTMRLEGDFYTEPLSSDSDVSFWSEHASGMALVYKTLELIENEYRNATGQRDREMALNKILDGIKRQHIAQRSAYLGNRQQRSTR